MDSGTEYSILTIDLLITSQCKNWFFYADNSSTEKEMCTVDTFLDYLCRLLSTQSLFPEVTYFCLDKTT